MNTLVKKEIRLLLPAFVGALALAILPIWIVPYDPWNRNSWPAYLYLFGTVMLALSSYGREIGLKTLPFILAQPLERARIWWTKVAVLAVSVAMVFDAWLVSGSLRCILQPELVVPPDELAAFGILAVVFAAGGLWMTLLLRQMAGAFWLTFLVPIAITPIEAIGGTDWMIFLALGLYAVAAFFLARWQFLHVQDTAWTGGVISFGGGRASVERSASRERRPWAALFWKEVQLQQVTLLGMGCLLVLNLGAVALRKAGAHIFGTRTLTALELFGAIWWFVPLVAGSQSVAEERKFGTMQAHLCLPISRRAQWLLKLMVVLVVSGVSWTLYWGVEYMAGIRHWTNDFTQTPLLFMVLALAGFYGSTLTGGVVQGLAAAMLTLLGLWVSLVLPYYQPLPVSRFQLCTGDLPLFISWPALVATLLWLAYRNFGNASESWRLWRRNVFALAGMAALSFGLTMAIYHRAWEWLTPLEARPGPAQMSLENPPVLYSYGGRGLAALLPDGRLWVDHLDYGRHWEFHGLPLGRKWMSLGGDEFAPGSNWVDAVANSRETVGIRSDGTLWVSERPRKFWDGNGPPLVEQSAGLIEFGHDTNWLSVARLPDWGMFLLKRDGTLWSWGSTSFNYKHEQPSLRDSEPRQLGTDSDWTRLREANSWIYAFAWKTDGSAWVLHDPGSKNRFGLKPTEQEFAPEIGLSRMSGLDNNHWRSLISSENFSFAGVREDGTLWRWSWYEKGQWQRKALSTKAALPGESAPAQMGVDSDWAELAGSLGRLVARKTDGSIWAWDVHGYWEPLKALDRPPVRLGARSDWVALGVVGPEIMTLAADGNLWGWPTPEPVGIFGDKSEMELAASRKPAKIENILNARK